MPCQAWPYPHMRCGTVWKKCSLHKPFNIDDALKLCSGERMCVLYSHWQESWWSTCNVLSFQRLRWNENRACQMSIVMQVGGCQIDIVNPCHACHSNGWRMSIHFQEMEHDDSYKSYFLQWFSIHVRRKPPGWKKKLFYFCFLFRGGLTQKRVSVYYFGCC